MWVVSTIFPTPTNCAAIQRLAEASNRNGNGVRVRALRSGRGINA